MRISHNKKFIYISIPKTGSTSIRSILNDYSEIKIDRSYHLLNLSIHRSEVSGFYPSNYWKVFTHMKAKDLKYIWNELFPNPKKQFDDYFKFTIVRNPWARRVSQWEFIKSKAKNDSLATFKGYCYSVMKDCHGSFTKFLLKSSKLDQQVNWIKDDNGNIILDYIAKLEDLQNGVNHICNKIDIDVKELPHINQSVTGKKHYSEYYTKKMVDFLADIYADDIAEFNYDFI